MQSNEIPVIDLEGSPYQIGLQHGEKLKEQIGDFYESVQKVHIVNNSALKAGREELLSLCRENLGFLQKYSPELMDEMQGIADGAGLPVEQILYLNTFLEFEDLRAPVLGARRLSADLWGCTTFNITPGGAKDGKSLIGQTFDMERYYRRFNVMLRIKPESAPAMLVYSFCGILGLNGLNSRGIGAVINKVVATDARPGVIFPFVMRKLLAQERIGDALGAVIFTRRAGGIVYQLAGREGVAFCAETSASCYELLPVEGAIAHTNHYVAPSMRKFETANWLSHGGSFVRAQVAGRILRDKMGDIDMDTLENLTRDHTNYPRSICAHGFEGEDEKTAFHTTAAMIMDLNAGSIRVCNGNPCETTYNTIILHD